MAVEVAVGELIAQVHRAAVSQNHAPDVGFVARLWFGYVTERDLELGFSNGVPPGLLDEAGGGVIGVVLQVEDEFLVLLLSIVRGASVGGSPCNGFEEDGLEGFRGPTSGAKAPEEGLGFHKAVGSIGA